MLKKLVLSLLFLFSLAIQAQETAIDKILREASQLYNEKPAESLLLCEEADRLAKEKGTDEYLGRIASCKTRYYILITDFEHANQEIQKQIDFYSEKKDTLGLIQAYSSKSILLRKMQENEASHVLLLNVIQLQRKIQDFEGLTVTLNNITLHYRNGGDIDSMKLFLDELEDLKPNFEPEDHYYFYQNMGAYYIEAKKYELAAAKLLQGLKVAEDLKMTDSRATCLMLLARAYRLNKQYAIAEKYGQESFEYSQANELIFEAYEALGELVKNYEAQGLLVKAYEVYKKQVAIQKQIYDLEKIQSVKQVEAKLQLAEKEKKIAEQEAEIQQEQAESAQARNKIFQMTGIIILVLVLLVFTLLIYFRTKRLNATIQEQKKEVEIKSLNLEEALNSIEDSLEYAKLIQKAMLPSQKLIKSTFEDSFIFFQPKDIVSGDFYWLEKTADRLLFAVGDCTGHGVPGAMVSMVCHEALNKVVKEYKLQEPAQILDRVRDLVVETFKQNKNLNDGMDIALIGLNRTDQSNYSLSYSGAHNPVWIFRKGDASSIQGQEDLHIIEFDGNHHFLIEIKADKQPIGKFEKSRPFKQKQFDLQPGDQIYLFSDGFADQFGGEKGKKIKTTNFKKLLNSLQDKNMEEQGRELHRFFENWMSWESKTGEKAQFEQIDDVCVIGVKL